jgi:hypothetical protein
MNDNHEPRQRDLDPNRVEEQGRARQEAADRLRDRGIPVRAGDSDEHLVDLLEAVERFEASVKSHGGDLMVNHIGTTEPQDPEYVLPTRGGHESLVDYRLRVEEGIDLLRQRGRRA